ncbi:MAG: protein of unknown function DUF1501 [uncultured Thermoleophilia bacterium]|uniref:DUF1501 domain-containing protein n=1 Tax=uncultured Thermoleophilia bacterium TaxID=1497501 RepID=A0A6J4TW09_9ACTN|nr:MAG: protein of unknown function DUF1501 [uncultured Thermoleophilia bacterium]
MTASHHGCDDHRRTLLSRRRALRHAAAPAVPVPHDLLEGGAASFLAEGRSRREFLQGGVGAFLALSAVGGLGPRTLLEQAAAAGAEAADAPILVTLYLDGGNDGLNTLIPVAGQDRSVYDARRRRIGIPAERALPLPGHAALGWHPQAVGLRTLFDSGQLAVLPAIDYPNPDFSHFHSSHFWRTGTLDEHAADGWLGRYLDVAGDVSNPLQGVAVQFGTDELLLSRRAPTCALVAPGDFRFWSPVVWDPDAMMRTFASLGGEPRTPALGRAVAVARQTVQVRSALAPLSAVKDENLPPTPVAYPDTDTGKGLRNLARMLGAGLGIRVATVRAAGGYDTHDDQPAQHGAQLADLGDSLVAWQADLAARGLDRRVVTMVWSEFGRRVDDNDSNGTDHGAGGLMLLVSPRVRAGLHADAWDLSRLDRTDGNIRVAIDFRDVYAGLLEQHLGTEAGRVLPGYRGTPTRLMAA